MTTQANQPRENKNRDFGLPQAKFKPIASNGNKWLKITAIIVGIVLLLGASVVYWFFFHAPTIGPSKAPIHEKYESELLKTDIDFIIDDTFSTTHQPPALEEKDDTKTLSTPPSHTPKPAKGAITKINTPQGSYYIVVGSFIDDDFASDYANQLAQQGIDVTLIAPLPGKYFSRVAVDQEDNFYSANEKAEGLKATYGEDIWVLKY